MIARITNAMTGRCAGWPAGTGNMMITLQYIVGI
jgi:hypothetical protein